MNILILCIYDNTKRNIKLAEIQRENIIKNTAIDYYFITYDENLNEEFKLIEDTLFIKGTENCMNILDKTIKSLKYFMNIKKYDFVVRTNISTAFNFKLLYNYLNEVPKNNLYIGAIIFKLSWLDEGYGITKENVEKYSLSNLLYYQGTCIIFSPDVVKFILDNSDKLIHDIIDDVSIGLFIKTYLPDAYFTYINTPKISRIFDNEKTYDNDSILYRHKTFNDDEDIKYMNHTFKIINNVNNLIMESSNLSEKRQE